MRTFIAIAVTSVTLGALASSASAQTRLRGDPGLFASQPFANCMIDEGYGRWTNCHQGGGGN